MPAEDLAAPLERELDWHLGRPAGAIMLLSTFHFYNPGHDTFKPTFTLDVFAERRQWEVAEVVERLAAFGPTNVAVETAPSNQGASIASTRRTARTPSSSPPMRSFSSVSGWLAGWRIRGGTPWTPPTATINRAPIL